MRGLLTQARASLDANADDHSLQIMRDMIARHMDDLEELVTKLSAGGYTGQIVREIGQDMTIGRMLMEEFERRGIRG